MEHKAISRRLFLEQSAGVAGTAWVRAVIPSLAAISQAACTAKEEKAPFTILNEAEALEFEAIAARIIPTTDTPGATEAGVIYFFDQSFGTFNAPMLPMLRGGLEELQSGIADGKKFSELTADDQDATLEQAQNTPFFQIFRIMTFAGFFGLSEYGGNKDGVGWELLGMNPHEHAYSSPFGYYDAEYLEENPDA
ncbi:MAG: gluconate 2-dehydrogenase subunit 3 family protein [Woeseiaceae bacterium]